MKTRYIKPTTEVVTLNLKGAILDEVSGGITTSMYDEDGKKDKDQLEGGGTYTGGDQAKHYNAWETWD